MDDTPHQPKPTLFNRLFTRVSGSITIPETPAQWLDLLRQTKAQAQNSLEGDTLLRLENLFKFSQLSVRDAMMTRAQMDVIKTTDSIDRIIAYAVDTAHSRFPVIEEDKDHIIGILHAKDLLKYIGSSEPFDLESLLRPACFVPEGKSLNALLKTFREQRLHMAIVVDEYGGTSGLVTFEDVIEQIIGNIEDEFDEDDSADNIFPVSAERWRINAVTEIEDINAYFGTDYSGEEADTIGGLVIQELGRLPVRGDKITLPPLLFTVARADHRRLHTLMAVRMKDKEHGREPHKE